MTSEEDLGKGFVRRYLDPSVPSPQPIGQSDPHWCVTMFFPGRGDIPVPMLSRSFLEGALQVFDERKIFGFLRVFLWNEKSGFYETFRIDSSNLPLLDVHYRLLPSRLVQDLSLGKDDSTASEHYEDQRQ
jgi:hypothetical protein